MMGTMSSRLFLLTALSLACGLAGAPGIAHAQIEPFHAKFDAVLTQHGVVGGGFAFVHGPAAATQYFFGEARQDSHARIDADTAYNWASITKTMTAIAILQLRDRGRISLDDPAVRYIPELRQVHDAFGVIDDITVRHLLTHSAGFRNPTWPGIATTQRTATGSPSSRRDGRR